MGSSHRMISGSVAMARASPTRLRMPPDMSAGIIPSVPGRSTHDSFSATRRAISSRGMSGKCSRRG
ncbi:conserved hypothetical protein [Stigmatella aurantiaca DW4/3-1]|uniref:Uncharacterized protein n=1 Tax=Stigmatella aurantiaca (strain DW4/3-1) TaxID=378806 RepID=Q08TD2_STIAD|nr:conserved hypothetical protein [Stigmatella aurantiaca DW4/3-1]